MEKNARQKTRYMHRLLQQRMCPSLWRSVSRIWISGRDRGQTMPEQASLPASGYLPLLRWSLVRTPQLAGGGWNQEQAGCLWRIASACSVLHLTGFTRNSYLSIYYTFLYIPIIFTKIHSIIEFLLSNMSEAWCYKDFRLTGWPVDVSSEVSAGLFLCSNVRGWFFR